MSNDLLDDQETLTLNDVCENCGLNQEAVMTYVQEGLVEVNSDSSGQILFSQFHVVRIQKAIRLERDLRLNPAGSVLVIELIAQIDALKNKLEYFERAHQE